MTLPQIADKTIPNYFSACLYSTALEEITFPNNLEFIGDYAFRQCSLTTVTFPASLKELGDHVFELTYLRDVYFLGKDAPKVGNDAFDKASYVGNGGFQPTSAGHPYGDTEHGYAERRNYMNGEKPFAVLHLRADLSLTERANYTDITRKYDVKVNEVDNRYEAFKDLYYGDAMIWPGQVSYNRAYENAEKGQLWNGEGTSYDSDNYMGLHKFTLVQYDVQVDDTKKWNFGQKGQKWWTLCVPFNMTKAQVSKVFGPETNVCKFSDVVRNLNDRTITLQFKDEVFYNCKEDAEVVINAHDSYMIFPSKEPGKNLIFEGYNFEQGSPQPTIIKAKNPTGSPQETETYFYRFIGNYLSRSYSSSNTDNGEVSSNTDNGEAWPVYMPQHAYFLGNNNGEHVFFYQIGDKGIWNPYTAIVRVFDGDGNVVKDDLISATL
jgi:hypothetical protein